MTDNETQMNGIKNKNLKETQKKGNIESKHNETFSYIFK